MRRLECSRTKPTLAHRRLNGIVLCYDKATGVGYITSDMGDIAVAKNDLLLRPQVLRKAQHVVFDLYDGPDCSFAAFVTDAQHSDGAVPGRNRSRVLHKTEDIAGELPAPSPACHEPIRRTPPAPSPACHVPIRPTPPAPSPLAREENPCDSLQYDFFCRRCQNVVLRAKMKEHERWCRRRTDPLTGSNRCIPTAPAAEDEEPSLHTSWSGDGRAQLYPSLDEFRASEEPGVTKFRR